MASGWSPATSSIDGKAGWAALWRGFLMLLVVASAPACGTAAERPPDIVLIVADDLGVMDLDSDLYEAPNLRKRFTQRFLNAYSACTVCSPSRAAIMAGQYPARLHLTDWIAGHVRPRAKLKIPEWTKRLPREQETLAERLAEVGYETVHLGKWHLGTGDHHARGQGFLQSIGSNNAGQPGSYFFPYRRGEQDPTAVDFPQGKPNEYLTDRLTDEALDVLRKPRTKPLFMYLAHYAVHAPLEAPEDRVDYYKAKLRPGMRHQNAVYAAMLESLDRNVGRILDLLEEHDSLRDTIVIFTSDNGALERVSTCAPYRAGKGSAYEGGVRIPLLVTGKNVTYAGGYFETPVISQDLYPTICEWAGAKIAADSPVSQDAISLAGWLSDTAVPVSDRALYWHYPHYHPGGATPYGAVRQGDWKLIEFYEDDRVELYDLKNDVGETTNLAEREPQKAGQLRKLLHEWREKVGAQMPTENPDYKPESQVSGSMEPLAPSAG